MYKAIIFDFFGVIYNDPSIKWLNRHGLSRGGEAGEIFRLSDTGLISQKETFTRLSQIAHEPVETTIAAWRDVSMIDDEIVVFTETLRQNYKTALISNASGEYLRSILKENKLEALFDEIVISGEVGLAKPGIEIFEHTLSKLGVTKDQAVFIDDNESFVRHARDLGISSICYLDLITLKKELAKLKIITN